MCLMRRTLFVVLMLMLFCGAALAQRPGPEFRRPLACEPLEPRTKLEAIDARYERVLIKGFSQIAILEARGGDIRVDAAIPELRIGLMQGPGGVEHLFDLVGRRQKAFYHAPSGLPGAPR